MKPIHVCSFTQLPRYSLLLLFLAVEGGGEGGGGGGGFFLFFCGETHDSFVLFPVAKFISHKTLLPSLLLTKFKVIIKAGMEPAFPCTRQKAGHSWQGQRN